MVSGVVLSSASLLLFASAVTAPMPARADNRNQRPMACADLVQLGLPDAVVRSAVEVSAGPFPFGNLNPTCTSDIASPQLPAFCRVMGTIAPQINFEVWLPLEGWNGKFQAFGNHGFAGNIDYSDLGPELVKGSAIAYKLGWIQPTGLPLSK